MKKTALILAFPILIALTLTGCGDKPAEAPASPAPVTATPTATPKPVSSMPAKAVATPTATGLGNTDAAGLESTVKDYNSQVNASNDKAKGIIDAYNARIKSATGQ